MYCCFIVKDLIRRGISILNPLLGERFRLLSYEAGHHTRVLIVTWAQIDWCIFLDTCKGVEEPLWEAAPCKHKVHRCMSG